MSCEGRALTPTPLALCGRTNGAGGLTGPGELPLHRFTAISEARGGLARTTVSHPRGHARRHGPLPPYRPSRHPAARRPAGQQSPALLPRRWRSIALPAAPAGVVGPDALQPACLDRKTDVWGKSV